MVTCEVSVDGELVAHATLAAPPHAGEYICFSNSEGARLYYKVETVVHLFNGGAFEVNAKPVERPQFHKG
jgi:hypothetical protein